MKILHKLFHPVSLVFILLPVFVYVSGSLFEYGSTDRFTPKESTLMAILACGVAAAWFLLFVFTVARTVKPKYKPLLVKVTAIGGTYCPKCKRDGGFFHYHYPPEEPFYRCENCNSKITDAEYEELMKPKELKEKDLEIYDVWESPNGNLFLKVSDDYSLALGTKGDHAPTKAWGDLEHTQYVKSSDVFPVKMVGRLIFSDDQ
jgi:hypothetical protein